MYFVVGRIKNVTQKSQVKMVEAEDVVSSGGDKRGLAECGDMDQQLTAVASTKFNDVPVGLLDEIFQCVYFSDLLGYRR